MCVEVPGGQAAKNAQAGKEVVSGNPHKKILSPFGLNVVFFSRQECLKASTIRAFQHLRPRVGMVTPPRRGWRVERMSPLPAATYTTGYPHNTEGDGIRPAWQLADVKS